MAHDAELAERIRECLAPGKDIVEKRMFGGLAFLLGGHIAVAASSRGGLMVGCEPDRSEELVAEAHVERMVMRGREMAGWLRVGVEAIESDAALQRWVDIGVAHASGQPPK